MTEETNPQATGQGGNGEQQRTTETKAWYEPFGLQPEDVGYIQNKKWDSPAKLLNSYKELEKFHGVPSDQIVKLPKDLADTDGWSKVYNRLGRPETVEGYGEFKMPEDVKATLDPNRVKWADSVMHKIGLTKTQRDALMAETAKFEQGVFEGFHKDTMLKQEAELASLKQEWGAGYEERAELGRRAVRQFLPGDENARGALLDKIESAVGTATMLKLFGNIGEQMLEDKSPMGDTKDRPFGYTKEQAAADKQALISELQADKARLANYNLGKGPDYDKMQRLIKIIAS